MSRAAIAAVAVAAFVASSACVTYHHVVVDGGELSRTAPLLRAYGSATVATDDEQRMDEADPPHHVHRRELLRTDQTLVVDGTARPVRDLVVLCDPTAGTAACPLTGLEGIPLTLRNYTTRSVGKALGGAAILTVLAVTVGAVACGIACAEGSTPKLASEITIGVVGAGVLGLVGWIVIDCYLLSGGCHD